MIFPSDADIREFTAYMIRARKIIIEEFTKLEGRPPNELDIQELLKMVVVPFGILKQQNGNSHFQSPQIAAQKQTQQPEQKQKNESSVNSVMDIVKEHSELSIEGEKIVMKKKIEPVDVFYAVRDEMERRGWKYTRPKQIGGDKWEPGFFEVDRARA
jgi:hypothetical protein